MKAGLLVAPGRFGIRDVSKPECPKGGVLVRVKACGVCSSDVKMARRGHRALAYPRILGHEVSGVVEATDNTAFKQGDRVQLAPGLRCGRCPACERNADNQCENRGIYGFSHDGGFAENVAVPLEGDLVGSLNLIPEGVSFREAALGEPLACCINAQALAGVSAHDNVLIMGGGPLGCLHALLARQSGAETIMVAEKDPGRRETADGITGRVVDTDKEDLFDRVMKETAGRGVDALILACSEVVLKASLVKLLAPRGKVSLFSGVPGDLSQVQIDLNVIHYKEIRIAGSYGCTAAQNGEAIGMISSGQLSVQRLLTHGVTLDGIEEGLEYTAARKGMKTVVEI